MSESFYKKHMDLLNKHYEIYYKGFFNKYIFNRGQKMRIRYNHNLNIWLLK